MAPHCKINLTFTKKEFDFIERLALSKNQSFYAMIQWEINKVFSGTLVPGDCEGDKERINKQINIPIRLWEPIACIAQGLGMTPTQLIYRVIIAPHLVEIIKEDSLAAEAGNSD